MTGRFLAASVAVLVMVTPATRASGLAFTPDGKSLIALGDKGTLHIYSPPDASEPTVIRAHNGDIHAVVVSADGKRIVTAGADGLARIWNTRTWKETATLRGHTKDVYAVSISPDGKRIATGGDDRTARIWDVNTGKERIKLDGHSGTVAGVCFSPDGRFLFTGTTTPDNSVRGFQGPHRGEAVRRWDATAGKQAEFPDIRGYTFAASQRLMAIGNENFAATPDGKGASYVGAQFTVTIATQSGKSVATVTKCGTGVWFSNDGLYLAVTEHGSGWSPPRIVGPLSSTRGLAVVDALDGSDILTSRTEILVAAFSPDGRRLAVVDRSGRRPHFVDLVPKIRKDFVDDPEAAWVGLADGNAKTAYESLWAMVDQGSKAVEFISKRVKPIARVTDDDIDKHVKGLNSSKFAEREAAAKALKDVGSTAVPALRTALKSPPSEEARRRLQELLDSAEDNCPTDANERRVARALVTLERINSKEARDVLSTLAEGAPGVWLTEDAAAALRRMDLRAGE